MQTLIDALKNGKIILYPTDTIWGIGCDATNTAAIERIFELKKREANQSLILLVENVQRLQSLVDVPEIAWQLMDVSEKPITIVYEKVKNLPKEVLAQDGSIAIRLVKDSYCKQLITKLNRPLVSTSANFSGEKSPMQFSEISEKLKTQVDAIATEKQNERSIYTGSSIFKIWEDGRFKIIRE